MKCLISAAASLVQTYICTGSEEAKMGKFMNPGMKDFWTHVIPGASALILHQPALRFWSSWLDLIIKVCLLDVLYISILIEF